MSRRSTMDEDTSDNPNPPNGIPERFQDSPASFLTQGESPAFGVPPRQNSSTLPEDDGMRALRNKIIDIQTSTVTPEEKARLMHELLTEGYTQSQISQTIKPNAAAESDGEWKPEKLVKQQRPGTPTSTNSFNFWAGATPGREAVEFHLTSSDLAPTYAPPPKPENDGAMEVVIKDEDRSLGCEHYKRNVKLQCALCDKWYTCRLCHDAKEDHVLPRKETKNMLCMVCGTAQKASDQCTHCRARSANYYCDVCHLWEDDPKRLIYHCKDCGICRVGAGLGKDFFHCKQCGLCMDMKMSEGHKHIERSTDCDCPICGEYMFSSPQTVVFMRCGHTIHRHCYHEHMKTAYKCPICQQTVVNMETQFRNLDRDIQRQPMPEGFRDTKALVTCNDCRAKSVSPYHWLGLKCQICASYNTMQQAIIRDDVIDETAQTADALAAVGLEQVDGTMPTASAEIPIPGSRPGMRRHSSHSGQYLSPSAARRTAEGRFDLFINSRLGRSASPQRGDYFRDRSIVQEPVDEGVWDDTRLDLFGRSRADLGLEEQSEDEESCSDEDETMDDVEEDDDDDKDEIHLFGHR